MAQLSFNKLPQIIYVVEYAWTYRGKTTTHVYAYLTAQSVRVLLSDMATDPGFSNIRVYEYKPVPVEI
jgi:hypothetical protein